LKRIDVEPQIDRRIPPDRIYLRADEVAVRLRENPLQVVDRGSKASPCHALVLVGPEEKRQMVSRHQARAMEKQV
jgi:hypothetical protein